MSFVDDPNILLVYSAKRGKLAGVKDALAHGADINSKDEDGKTALICAIENIRTSTVRFLVKSGASLDAVDEDGFTPLVCAASYSRNAFCNLLVKCGAEIEKRDKRGETPLMKAAANGNVELIKLFLKHGAKVNRKNRGGEIPLAISIRNYFHRLRVYEQYLENKRKNKDCDSCFVPSKPDKRAYLETVALLVKAGTDVNLKDNSGKSPLQLVRVSKDSSFVKLLLKQLKI